MTQQENQYYEELKANPSLNQYVFNQLFVIINGNPVPKPGVAFKFLGGIPYVYNALVDSSPFNSMFPVAGLPQENPNAASPFDSFEKLLENTILNPKFRSIWGGTYSGTDIGNTFLPKAKTINLENVEVRDAALLFEKSNPKENNLNFTRVDKIIFFRVYTYPKGAPIADNIYNFEAEEREVHIFLEMSKNKQLSLSVKFGNNFKKILELYRYQPEKLEKSSYPISLEYLQNLASPDLSNLTCVLILEKALSLSFAETPDTESSIKKVKINFTIGMFFDGTCNNRFNSDKQYYSDILSADTRYDFIPTEREVVTKDGLIKIESDSSYWNPYSNIALMHDLYIERNIDGGVPERDGSLNITLRQYVEGIGTSRDKTDDLFGVGFGEGERGIIGKVKEGCELLAKRIAVTLGEESEIGSITFDVFGFSRGAASARHFCNQVVGKDAVRTIYKAGKSIVIDPNENSNQQTAVHDNLVITSNKLKTAVLKKARLFALGHLGDALKVHEIELKTDFHYPYEKDGSSLFVKIRFLGIFETVVSQMVVKNHYFREANSVYPGMIFFEKYLDKIKVDLEKIPIDYIFHIQAANEYRKNFALTKTGTVYNKEKKQKEVVGYELEMMGAHSDIGGGYAATVVEKNILDYENNWFLKSKLTRLETLKRWYMRNRFCWPDELEIKQIKIKINLTMPIATKILYQLISTRKVKPRYSVITMNTMKNIAKIAGVPIGDNANGNSYSFEYETPEELKIYEKHVLYVSEKGFRNRYKLKGPMIADKKFEKIDSKIVENIQHNFLHLSSSYNSTLLLGVKGDEVVGIKDLDQQLYANTPSYSKDKKTVYEREIFKNKQ